MKDKEKEKMINEKLHRGLILFFIAMTIGMIIFKILFL